MRWFHVSGGGGSATSPSRYSTSPPCSDDKRTMNPVGAKLGSDKKVSSSSHLLQHNDQSCTQNVQTHVDRIDSCATSANTVCPTSQTSSSYVTTSYNKTSNTVKPSSPGIISPRTNTRNGNNNNT